MPGGKCKFNKSWLESHSWLKEVDGDVSKAHCKLCNSTFKVDVHGYTDVTRHQNSAKHKSVESNAAGNTLTKIFAGKLRDYSIQRCNSLNLSIFLKNSAKLNDETSKMAAMEAVFVYHIAKENQTFESANCMSDLIRSIFGDNPKFTCGRKKAEAILSGMYILVRFQTIAIHLANLI